MEPNIVNIALILWTVLLVVCSIVLVFYAIKQCRDVGRPHQWRERDTWDSYLDERDEHEP